MTSSNTGELVLVTGGSGFVGIHCIVQLLQKGYQVRTTLRNPGRWVEVLEMLRQGGVSSTEHLSFVGADLNADAGWDAAVKDCDYVLHVASPIYLKAPKHADEMILPAVEGTLRVLRAARDAGVRRVVMTSNFGAVGYSHRDTTSVITEESWTDPHEKGLSAYNRSKVLAERAAWDFMAKEGGALELSVINPVGIFGPSLGRGLSSGYELLKKMLDGSMKAIPNMTLGIVDVRDVADLHIRAMISPAAGGQRFLALSGEPMSLPQIAVYFRERLGDAAGNVSTKRLPDWVVRLAALVSPVAKNLAPMLGRYRRASNAKAVSLLGWQPRSKEEAILASAQSLVQYGHIKP
jgi:dihydroflavonol-4-reductase